ncbi:MAG: hypothetical protein AAF797_02085 [Planctomycetota bacterium]
MPEPWSTNASGIAIRILHELDALDTVPASLKQQAIDYLRSCQDPDDGLFRDPLETDDRHDGPHSWEQVWGQRHSAATEALVYLNADPLYPLPDAQFADLTRIAGSAFTLEHTDWRNPWGHGESWARAIEAFLNNNRLTSKDRADLSSPVLREAFAAFEQHIIDPESGYPSRRMPHRDDPRAMAGLFKIMMAYVACGRPYPHAEAAIDSTLALQHEDGEFGCRNNMCINWDSVWVLLQLDRQLAAAHHHPDIVHAGQRLADHLIAHYRKPDGGFAFHGRHCISNHHSIRLCDTPQPIGDMLGTTMALYCLQYADHWLCPD